MLTFRHATDELEDTGFWYRWPFVYLHGDAETHEDIEGSYAPDICLTSRKLSSVLTGVKFSTSEVPDENIENTFLACVLERGGEQLDAVVGLSCANGVFGGRVALVSDIKAMRHVYNPREWR